MVVSYIAASTWNKIRTRSCYTSDLRTSTETHFTHNDGQRKFFKLERTYCYGWKEVIAEKVMVESVLEEILPLTEECFRLYLF